MIKNLKVLLSWNNEYRYEKKYIIHIRNLSDKSIFVTARFTLWNEFRLLDCFTIFRLNFYLHCYVDSQACYFSIKIANNNYGRKSKSYKFRTVSIALVSYPSLPQNLSLSCMCVYVCVLRPCLLSSLCHSFLPPTLHFQVSSTLSLLDFLRN